MKKRKSLGRIALETWNSQLEYKDPTLYEEAFDIIARVVVREHERRKRNPLKEGRKLTDVQCAQIVSLRLQGWTLQAIADKYGVDQSYVSLLARGLRRVA